MSEKSKIACPHCKIKLAVPMTAIGQARKCPSCNVQFNIRNPANPTDPLSSPAPAPIPVETPLQRGASLSSQSFQSKLAQRRSKTPKRPMSRKEKLQRAKTRQSRGEDEFDWQTASWGRALVILAFVSVFMPDAESIRGGRGVIRLLGRALLLFGPFAPLLGMLLGLGGVGLIVTSAKICPRQPSSPSVAVFP